MKRKEANSSNLLDSRLLKPSEAARYLNTSVRTLRRLFYRGKFSAIRSRNFVRYDRLELDRWIEDQKERGRPLR